MKAVFFIKELLTPGGQPREGVFERGDLLSVMDDTGEFGLDEIARNDLFLCVSIPGINANMFRNLMRDLPADEEGRFLLQKRRDKIDIDALLSQGTMVNGVLMVDQSKAALMRTLFTEKPLRGNPEFIGSTSRRPN